MFLKAKILKKRTDIANKNLAVEFWEDFKDKLLEKMKKRADEGYYSLSIFLDENEYSLENIWVYDNNKTDKVVYELNRLGYSVSVDRFRGIVRIDWK